MFWNTIIGKVVKWLAPNLANTLIGIGGNRLANASLTGKEQQQNQFNAEQAQLQRDFARDERLQSQEFNAGQAQQQMNFQERMAQTEYQRAVSDMQAAGLNPALAATHGISGASASGAMAQSSPAAGAAASGSSSPVGLSDLMSLARTKKELEKMDSEIEVNRSAAGLSQENTNLVRKQVAAFDPMNEATLDNLRQELKNKKVQELLDSQHISESEARTQVELNNAFLSAMDIKYRDELNQLSVRLRIAEIAESYKRIDTYTAQINELYQRAILESAQAGLLDQQTINAALEEGILHLDKESKQFSVDHLKSDRNWRIAGQVVSSVVGLAGSAAGIMTGTGLISSAGSAALNASTNAARLSWQKSLEAPKPRTPIGFQY